MTSQWIARPSVEAGWTLVGSVVIAIVLVSVATSLGTGLYGMPVALSFAVTLVHSVALPFALRRPLLAGLVSVAMVTLLAFAQAGVTGYPWPWAVTTLITQSFLLFLVGVQARSRVGVAVWVLAVVGSIAAVIAGRSVTEGATLNIVIATAVTGVALGAGVIAREWLSIRAQLSRERALAAGEHEGRVLAEEKTRIARELHDVVAHSMSVINVQASSAAFRHRDVPEALVRELDEMAEVARSAIIELRGVLSVLREDSQQRELVPQPGLGDIPQLVDFTSQSGVEIDMVFDPLLEDASVGDLAGLTAYRVVQEAMSNAMRHAPGASIRVECRSDEGWLEISVSNSRSPAAAIAGGSGHGLMGMRERVLAVRGVLSAGPTSNGGYAVVARIPLRTES